MSVTLPWNRYVTGTMKLKIIYSIHTSVFLINTGETYYKPANVRGKYQGVFLHNLWHKTMGSLILSLRNMQNTEAWSSTH